MPHPHLVDALVILAALVLVGVAFALYNVCNGGGSLVLVGGAVALLYVTLARSGAWATLIPICIIAALLVGAGWYVASTAGCHL